MAEKRLFPRPSNAGDFVQRTCTDGLGALFPVSADREAMRLIAQSLQEIEDWALVIQPEGWLSLAAEMFAAGFALDAFGHSHDDGVPGADFVQGRIRGINLPRSSIDEHEIGPFVPLLVAVVFALPHQTAKSAGQHFAHHREII